MIGKYSAEDGERLLKLARESIMEDLDGEKPKIPDEKQFRQARGVFVTLTEKGELRGCIGFPYPTLPVAEAVYEAAKRAAFSDTRFSPVEKEDLEKIKIEISILTQPEEVKKVDEIKVGEDGLIGEYLGYSGLLLPQVAVEYKMSRIDFLEAICDKAGLSRNSWQNKNFKLKKFQVQIFSEK